MKSKDFNDFPVTFLHLIHIYSDWYPSQITRKPKALVGDVCRCCCPVKEKNLRNFGKETADEPMRIFMAVLGLVMVPFLLPFLYQFPWLLKAERAIMSLCELEEFISRKNSSTGIL